MELISRINWVDILVVILMARISYVALADGLSHEIFPLIGTFITAVVSAHYYHEVSAIMRDMAKLPEAVTDLLGFLALLTAVGIVFKLIRMLVDAIMKVTWHPLVERGGGLVFGLLRSALVVSVVLMTLSLTPLSYLQDSIKGKSLTGRYFLNIVPDITDKIDWAFPVFLKK